MEELENLSYMQALTIIDKIHIILSEYDYNDFECIEEILLVMEANGFYCSRCHDF